MEVARMRAGSKPSPRAPNPTTFSCVTRKSAERGETARVEIEDGVEYLVAAFGALQPVGNLLQAGK
jgi:hypothetical protein